MPEKLLYTIQDAAVSLAIGRSRVYELLNAGDIEYILIGRSRRIPASALEDYIDRLRVAQVHTASESK
jgi:excisionase family DNA binding protein